MYTHLHSTEWILVPDSGNDRLHYFSNRVSGQILAELQSSNGFEYYLCTTEQMSLKLVGNYLGCRKSKAKNGREADIMVYNHDTQPERTIDLNDEIYLDY